jgi:hypothetical protein
MLVDDLQGLARRMLEEADVVWLNRPITIRPPANSRSIRVPSTQGEKIMNCLVILGFAAVLFAGSASGQESRKPATPEALAAEIEALKAPRVAWREIDWKSCLIEGLKESREKNKPALLWVFIDRPIDDARC